MLKIVDLFSGIGAVNATIWDYEINQRYVASYVEWDINAIMFQEKAYLWLFEDFYLLNEKQQKELNQIVTEGNFSINSKTPATKLPRKMNLYEKEKLYSWFKQSNNQSRIENFKIESDIDLLVYSFPCQGLSVANLTKNKGIENNKSRSHIVWEVIRILNEAKQLPKMLLMENVPALVSTYKEEFEGFLNQLEELGYKTKWAVIDSSEYGSIQKRKRVFAFSTLNQEVFDKFEFKKPGFVVRDRIENLVDFKNEKYSDELLQAMIPDTPSRRKIIKQSPKITVDSKYIRTITTKQDRFPNAGIIHCDKWTQRNGKKLLPYRYLTPRECFLIMGFSNEQFDQGKSEFMTNETLYRLAGNSIVIKVIDKILEDIGKVFHEVYKR